MMSLDTLLEHLDAGQPLVTGTEAFDCMHGYSYEKSFHNSRKSHKNRVIEFHEQVPKINR